MNSSRPAYSVIVPVYNSATTLEDLVTRIEKVMALYESHELLLIDDCSTDNSWEKLKQLKNGRPHIRLLRLTRNFGQAAVHICGINEARGNIMITIDDDLQYPPEEIPKLISHFDPARYYLVCGVPHQKKNNLWQRAGSALVDAFINKLVLGSSKPLRFSSFRILTKKTLRREEYNERWMRNTQIFFSMVSPRYMDYVFVDHVPRKKGKSNYNFLKRMSIALDLVMVATALPVYFFLVLFLLAAIATLSVLVILITGVDFIHTGNMLLPLLLGGVSLMLLGFAVLFRYLRQIYLGYLGTEPYAIWEEA